MGLDGTSNEVHLRLDARGGGKPKVEVFTTPQPEKTVDTMAVAPWKIRIYNLMRGDICLIENIWGNEGWIGLFERKSGEIVVYRDSNSNPGDKALDLYIPQGGRSVIRGSRYLSQERDFIEKNILPVIVRERDCNRLKPPVIIEAKSEETGTVSEGQVA